MATKRSSSKSPPATSRQPKKPAAGGSDKSTVSGPSARTPARAEKGLVARAASALLDGMKSSSPDVRAEAAAGRLAEKMAGTDEMSRAFPFNAIKPAEFGRKSALKPPQGQSADPPSTDVSASTITETNSNDKTGDAAEPGENPNNAPLEKVRVDSGGRALTTNQGVAIADNQNSLKAGLRGPTLLEDFILRDKITHFDHERIPERVVHARGSAAHGFFECYDALTDLTMAAPFAEAGKRTPVFVRFSTVVGERGSFDLARDVRGFAVKFYTDQGNWDLVGNNIPVFFIQDPMKFPDLVHAVKPEPHHAMPQAASAHDTFWDFASLMPEITHMLMWVMSDRAIPRSYRMMQGFGVHTFRLVNAQGASVFVKFHWNPMLGTHSVVWDEAVRINGADSDFHRRDLWEAIEGGAYPEYELGLQIFTEEQAEGFSFDVLDSTKIIPEELVPLRPVGRMVLNRNPDNFFAETEQVAFCTQHVVPGIDFSNDPLLQGRNFSYHDTQLTRLGGPNFHEIPINASVAQVHNNQRDGFHRQSIPRGRVAYEPNSLGGGCPFQAGNLGFMSFPEPIEGDKLRGKPEKFADHYTQAALFYNSQTAVEQSHIVEAFRFELTKVQTPAVRARMVAGLLNVDRDLASRVAEGLGIDLPEPLPRVLAKPTPPEVTTSGALSLFSRPGDGSIRTRKVAILVTNGVNAEELQSVYDALTDQGAVVTYVGHRLGAAQAATGEAIEVEITMETAPAVLFDALVLPSGKTAIETLGNSGQAMEFLKLQYRHCKPILAMEGASALLEGANISPRLPDGGDDPGLLIVEDQDAASVTDAFVQAIARHRHFERQMDPPMV
ncbi:MAG TPA: catalase [Burkholderiaceae bacterium]|nr:catalase [Burkholderiaceae bacterium]